MSCSCSRVVIECTISLMFICLAKSKNVFISASGICSRTSSEMMNLGRHGYVLKLSKLPVVLNPLASLIDMATTLGSVSMPYALIPMFRREATLVPMPLPTSRIDSPKGQSLRGRANM